MVKFAFRSVKTMEISLLLFIYLMHWINCLENNSLLTKYLDDRAKSVGEKLIRRARTAENSYTVKFNDLNGIKLIGNYSSGEIFTFFDTPYALLNQELYQISRDNYSLVYRFPKKIHSLKTKEFKTIGFVTFDTDTTFHIFGFSNETQKIFKIQNIVHINITDAKFFEQRNNLYLVIASYNSNDFTTITIYKFMNSHFDELQTFWTSSVTKIGTFGNKESEIIVILHTFATTSVLYEFKNENIRKIQKFDTVSPREVLHFRYSGNEYVALFSGRGSVDIYLWTGSELLFWEQFNIQFELTEKKSMFYVGEDPYLLTRYESSLVIFSLKNQFLLIYNSILNGNWTETWTYDFMNHTLVTLGPTKEDAVEINTMSISVQKVLLEQHIVEEQKLSNCFLDLEKSVYALRNKLRNFENNTGGILREANNLQVDTEKLNNLSRKYSAIKATTGDQIPKTLVFHDSTVITVPISAKNITAKNIYFKEINKQKWQPHRWLSHKLPQRIPGVVKAQLVQVDDLESNQNLFHDLLLSKGNQTLSGSVKVNNLKIDQLETRNLNNISTDDFYYKSHPVGIQGLKTFPKLQVGSLETATIDDVQSGTKILKHTVDQNLTIANLWVENINGINFEEFKNSVFRLGSTDTIEGNLTISKLQAKNLNFDTLSKRSKFLTTSTEQVINSSVTILKIFAGNVQTKRFNGIDFENSIATFGDSIHGPISIKHLNIQHNLELKGDVSNEFLQFNETHIVGTNESDFLQRYTGNVRIKGNLILRNLNIGNSAKLMVSESEFDPKINQFWTKSTPQDIPVHFEAQNGVTTPHLNTIFINNESVDDYLLNSTEPKKPAKFYFDNVTIKGNVLLNPDEHHSPDLQRIQRDSVKVNGTYRIKGRKKYSKILKVDKLETNYFEGREVPGIGKKSQKPIRNLIIKGDLISKKLMVESINNVNVKEVVENSVYIDRPRNLSELNFENVTATNIFIKRELNGQNISDFLEKTNQIDKIDKIDVYVDNHVAIKNIEDLSTINDQDVNRLLHFSKYDNGTIFGDKFLGNLTVKDFYVVSVNDVNLQILSRRILYKAWNQTITKPFTFTNLNSENLLTDQINEFHVKHIIDVSSTKPQTILAPFGLKVEAPAKAQHFSGQLSCNIQDSLRNIRNPVTQFWDNVVVTGNVTFWDKECLISRIFDEVVTREKNNQVVAGKVTFLDHISVNNITALKNINNIDLMEIIEDAFLNRPDVEQIVTGKKIFAQLETEELVSLQNTIISKINDINILEISDKIISKNSILDVPIKGNKVFFGELQTNKIETEKMLKIEPRNLVSFENSDQIPRAIFESINVVDNFNVKFINGMSFEVLLKERFLIKAPKQILTGNYFFRDISIAGNVTTPQINDIQMENVIYDEGAQIIENSKKFTENLVIIGNITAELINGLKLSESYEQAVLNNEETNFPGKMHFMKVAFMGGNIQTKYINGVPVEYMMDTNANYSLQTEAHQIHEITKIISVFVNNYLNITIRMPNEILYLEKSTDLQISLPNTISAQVVETKNDVLIHTESEENGDVCGLPKICKCPVQQTMQISSEHSVNVFINKAMQRIYTYYDEDIKIHFITHSISTSATCRTSQTKVLNEVSSLTWNTPSVGNNTGGFFVHRAFFNGYISDIKFFTISGQTYVVVGVYYDPVLNTYSVDSILLRFNKEKTSLEEIQRIPTFGVKTISLFPTAQGVVLVMGNNIPDQFNNTSTEMFRFSEAKQQFEILREVVAFRSVFAEGVVLERDSLIILANEHSNLHILKYRAEYDNYYFYQSFQLDYPVSSMSVFYADGFGISDVYLTVVTSDNKYFIYSFRFIEGWKLEFSGELEGIKSLVPFKLNKKSYLFAPSSKISSLLTLVKHDSD